MMMKSLADFFGCCSTRGDYEQLATPKPTPRPTPRGSRGSTRSSVTTGPSSRTRCTAATELRLTTHSSTDSLRTDGISPWAARQLAVGRAQKGRRGTAVSWQTGPNRREEGRRGTADPSWQTGDQMAELIPTGEVLREGGRSDTARPPGTIISTSSDDVADDSACNLRVLGRAPPSGPVSNGDANQLRTNGVRPGIIARSQSAYQNGRDGREFVSSVSIVRPLPLMRCVSLLDARTSPNVSPAATPGREDASGRGAGVQMAKKVSDAVAQESFKRHGPAPAELAPPSIPNGAKYSTRLSEWSFGASMSERSCALSDSGSPCAQRDRHGSYDSFRMQVMAPSEQAS